MMQILMATPFVMTLYPNSKQLATPRMNALKCRTLGAKFCHNYNMDGAV